MHQGYQNSTNTVCSEKNRVSSFIFHGKLRCETQYKYTVRQNFQKGVNFQQIFRQNFQKKMKETISHAENYHKSLSIKI